MPTKFLKFRPTECNGVLGFCTGRYRVDGFICSDHTNKDGTTKKVKRWIPVTSSNAMSKEQAMQTSDEMNKDIDNINKSMAEQILKEHELNEHEKNTKEKIEEDQ